MTLDEEEDDQEVYSVESLYPINMQMTIHHRYYSIKYICESIHLSQEIKDEIIMRVFGQDGSDSTIQFRNLSTLRLPDAALKAKIW
jgi:hypothetical protein